MVRSAAAALLAGVLAFVLPSAASAAFPAANGPISYERPATEGPWSFLRYWSPTGARLPARLASWQGSHFAKSFAPDLRSVAGSALGPRHNALAVARASGRRWRVVTHPRRFNEDTDPEWSPDGRSLVFIRWDNERRDDFVMTVNVRSGRVRRLARGLEAAWSTRGRIAYWHFRGSRSDIWTINTRGGDRRQVTRVGDAWAPEFSPDGSQIMFSHEHDLYTVAADGGMPEALTHWATDPDRPFLGYGEGVFSPDGERIAYVSGLTIRIIPADGDGDVLGEFSCDEPEPQCEGMGDIDWLPASRTP